MFVFKTLLKIATFLWIVFLIANSKAFAFLVILLILLFILIPREYYDI